MRGDAAGAAVAEGRSANGRPARAACAGDRPPWRVRRAGSGGARWGLRTCVCAGGWAVGRAGVAVRARQGADARRQRGGGAAARWEEVAWSGRRD